MRQSQAISIVGLIGLIGVMIDRYWVLIDQSVPAWDQSHHLTGTLNYLHALQTSQFFQESWWHGLWILSHKYPPLTYILTGLLQGVIGKGVDQALWVNSFFTVVLLFTVYQLGNTLFNPKVALWGTGLCLLIPGLYYWRLQFLLDTPVMVFTVLAFYCLTVWRVTEFRDEQWKWIFGFGVSLGLGLMTKQIILFFLFFPLLWVFCESLWRRRWERILQLFVGGLVSVPIWGFWYRTNWIYLLSTFETANMGAAAIEGDPSLDTLAAWIYYFKTIPQYLSWELLIVPVVGIILQGLGLFPKGKEVSRYRDSILWLVVYVLGSYLICSAAANKDFRYIMPYLPIVALLLGYGLIQWRGNWRWVRWVTVLGATGIMVGKLFTVPVLTPMVKQVSPHFSFYAETTETYPHQELIGTVIKTEPYLRSPLAVIPNIAEVNHNNINYYGALANFQVYGRELGGNEEKISQDQDNFHWFVTKTGENGLAKDPQLVFAENLTQNEAFKVEKSWTLFDNSTLSLYHRQENPVTVKPVEQKIIEPVKLVNVEIPSISPAGVSIPVTYTWVGEGEKLQSGIILLTWQSSLENFWIHDHRIGLGRLQVSDREKKQVLEVTEKTAMLPTEGLPAGTYTLKAEYYNPTTGEITPLSIPTTSLQINANVSPTPSPPLDYVTQLRNLALFLPQGLEGEGLDILFQQVGRLNIYDPIQDYLQQAEDSLSVRLETDPKTEWLYALTLAHALQEDAKGAIASLQTLTQLNPKDPYPYAYLAFVHLHQFQPKAAQAVLNVALDLKPNQPEFQALEGVAAIMQGDIFRGWRLVEEGLLTINN